MKKRYNKIDIKKEDIKKKDGGKILWNRVLIALIFLISLIFFLYDFYQINIEPFFTKQLVTFSPFGVITFATNCMILGNTFDKLYKWYKEVN